ncbi:MAG: hypothetical protein VX529_11025 [Pseudomonadota bacterium]|nr:hypothetical protein [Pseudomonadota bacterium]
MRYGLFGASALPSVSNPFASGRERDEAKAALSGAPQRRSLFGRAGEMLRENRQAAPTGDRLVMALAALGGDTTPWQRHQMMRAETSATQQEARAENAQQKGMTNRAIQLANEIAPGNRAMMNAAMLDPETFVGTYLGNMEASTLSGGQTRYNPMSGESYTADTYDIDSGQAYRQGPGGFEIQGETLGADETRLGMADTRDQIRSRQTGDALARDRLALDTRNIDSQIGDRAADNQRADMDAQRQAGTATRDREDTIRGEYGDVANDYQDLLRQYDVAETAYAQNNAVGDLQLVVAFTKALDPGSVAREGEVNLTSSAQSTIEQWQNSGRRLAEGGTRLGPQVRQELIAALRDLERRDRDAFQRQRGFYESMVEREQLNPENIFSWSPRESRGADQGNIDDLLDRYAPE